MDLTLIYVGVSSRDADLAVQTPFEGSKHPTQAEDL